MSQTDGNENASQASGPVESGSDQAALARVRTQDNTRMFAALAVLNSDKEQPAEKPEDAEEDEEIKDDDVRYRNACDVAANILREMDASKIKPGYEEYEKAVSLTQTLKPFITILVTAFIFLSKPDWCSALGSKIDYSCAVSLDPNYPVTFVHSSIPMISDSIKFTVCLAGMILITIIELINISVRNASTEKRNSFVVMFLLTLAYSLLFVVDQFQGYKVHCSDLLPVVFVVMSFERLKTIFFKSIQIIALSRDVIIFFFFFIFVASLVARVTFFAVPDYYDAEEPNIFTMNFKTLGNSFWSVINSVFLIDGEALLITRLFTDWKFLIVCWVVIGLSRKLILFNFLIAQLYNFYNSMFDKEVAFVNRNPRLARSIKEDIAKMRFDVGRIRSTIGKISDSGNVDENVINIEEFYKARVSENAAISDNPDNFALTLDRIIQSPRYIGFIAILQLLSLVCLVVSMSFGELTIPMYALIFVFNFVLMLDCYLAVESEQISTEKRVLKYLDLLGSGVLCGLLMIYFLISDEDYVLQMRLQNPVLRKAVGLILISKIGKLVRLLNNNDQIRVVFDVFAKSLGFVVDIFGSILITIFIYSTLGIALFGGNASSDIADIFRQRFGTEMDPIWMALTFNDYWHSFLTLFCVMIGGWPRIMMLNTLKAPSPSIVYNIFFISFFFFANLCFLNIIFGFLIDNVSVYLTGDIEQREKKKRAAKGGEDGDDGSGGRPGKDAPEEKDADSRKKKLNLSAGLDEFVGRKPVLASIVEREGEDNS